MIYYFKKRLFSQSQNCFIDRFFGEIFILLKKILEKE